MPTQDFERWGRQYSGGDGGNANGKIWLFGVEYGAPVNSDRLENFEFEDVSNPGEWPSENREDYLSYCNSHNTKCLKLLTLLANQPIDKYREFAWENRVFCHKGDYFKFNLYPLPFRSRKSHWSEKWTSTTGLSTKSEYVKWCRENRFPAIENLYRQKKPELVICNGLSEREGFAEAFGYSSANLKKHSIDEKTNIYSIENLIIIPHLGQWYGSDQHLHAYASFIKKHFTLSQNP